LSHDRLTIAGQIRETKQRFDFSAAVVGTRTTDYLLPSLCEQEKAAAKEKPDNYGGNHPDRNKVRWIGTVELTPQCSWLHELIARPGCKYWPEHLSTRPSSQKLVF